MPVLKDHRHELFARRIAEGLSPTDAMREAGIHSGSVSGNAIAVNGKNLEKRPAIAARIMELREQAAARTTVTAARVLEEMAKIGFANMIDYIKVQEDGSAYVDLNQIDRDKAAAISEVVVDTYMEGKGDEAREVKRVRLKLHDKRGALMDMGRHLGMFTQRVEVTGKDGGPIQHQSAVEVSLLNREEREMLKQLLLLAAERKRGKELGIQSPTIDAEFTK